MSAEQYYRQKEWLQVIWFCSAVLYLVVMTLSFSAAVTDRIQQFSENSVNVISVYSVVFYLGFVLWTAGLEIYSGYWLELRAGRSTMTLREWGRQAGKKHLKRAGVVLVALQVGYFFLEEHTRWWWVWGWAGWCAVRIGIDYGMILFRPLYARDEPLPDQELAALLKHRAATAGVSVEEVQLGRFSLFRPPPVLLRVFPGIRGQFIVSETTVGFLPEEMDVLAAGQVAWLYSGQWWQLLIWQVCSVGAGFFGVNYFSRLLAGRLGFITIFDVSTAPLLLMVGAVVGMGVYVLELAVRRRFCRARDRIVLGLTRKPEGFISVMVRQLQQQPQALNPPAVLRRFLYECDPIADRIRRAQDFAHSIAKL